MMRLLSGIFLSITIALLFGSPAPAESAPPDLESQFLQNPMWTGSDGAYSIDMRNGKALWLFSDTFIGIISGGKRNDYTMINNSIGVQDINAGKMSFFWNHQGKKPESYFPAGNGYWLWLGDGVFANNKVYCFAKRIAAIPGKEGDPYGFVWKQDEIIVIDNPTDSPDNWKVDHLALPFTTDTLHLGTACLVDGQMLYVMGMHEKTREMLLARIALDKLQKQNTGAFEFLQKDNQKGESWSKDFSNSAALFDHAAAEASLTKVGNRFVCVYHLDGLGAKIVVRTSPNVAGPWSADKLVYTVPDNWLKRGNCYAGKGHPEQRCPDGSMIVTYLINPGKLEQHAKDPYAYFPHVAEIKIPQ